MKKVRLAELCEIVIGRTPTRSENTYWGKGHKWVSISDMKEEVVFSTKEEITNKAIESIRCRKIPKGTLLLSFKLSIGKLAFAGTDLYTNEAIAALIIKNPDLLYPKYLFHALKKVKFVGGNQAVMGVTLNSKSLAELKIPLPSIEDQIRIAEILTKAEALIAKRKESIKALDELLKSTFLEMFGFNNGSYKNYSIVPLSTKTEIVSGVTKGKKYLSNDLREAPYMRVANVQDGYLDLTEIKTINVMQAEIDQYKLLKGDLLLTEGGDPDKLGRGTIWNNEIEGCIHQNHIFRVRIKPGENISPNFLSALIGSKYGKDYFLKAAKQTTGIASINSTQLKAFPLLLPPLKIQNRFAEIVKNTKSIKASYQRNLSDLENLYTSLSQQVFKSK